MIGLALSGGGSRAMAYHLGCLRALDDLGILERVKVLSTISGGSVIGAYYAYTPQKPFAEFESDIRQFLAQGFHRSITLELCQPQNLISCGTNWLATKADAVIARIRGSSSTMRRFPSRTDIFHQVLQRDLFASLRMSDARRNNLDVVIGACELRTGTAFRFGSTKSGGWRHGEIRDDSVEVGLAVAASAAYPLFLPPIDRIWRFSKNGSEAEQRVLITDGGVYDNLGVQVLEPGRDSTISLHNFPCEHLIVCNAGVGQELGDDLPLGLAARLVKSFGVVHRRVQDSAMQRLHHLKQAGLVKGFAMPYLGQQDSALPWKQDDLVSRESVMSYPTDFAAMDAVWIDKLSARGEQLTRGLVTHYLADVL